MKNIKKNAFDGHLVFKNSKAFNTFSGRIKHNESLKKITKFYEKKINLKQNQLNRNYKMFCINNSKKCFQNSKKIFKKNGFNYHKCGCEIIYVNPVLKEQIFHSNLYNENSYTKVMSSKHNLRLDLNKFKYGLNKVKLKKNQKKVLDIGCGFGFFLDVAKKKGLDVYGSELNNQCDKILKEKKIPNLNLNELKNKKFDLITLWTVFEHIINPNEFIKKIIKLLNKKGKILINVPNVNSLSARILHEKCSMFHGHQHLNFYSPDTLTKLLNKNKIKVTNMETIISDIDTVRNYLSYQSPYEDICTQEYFFLNPDKIHRKLMGYTILAIGEKK